MFHFSWILICFSIIYVSDGQFHTFHYYFSDSGYTFTCLDNCECDTSEGIIQCGYGGRTQLELPSESKLPGFKKIVLTDNNLVSLPEEQKILEHFPDLEVSNSMKTKS